VSIDILVQSTRGPPGPLAVLLVDTRGRAGRCSRAPNKIEARARAHLAEIPTATSLLDELVSGLKRRAAAS
jgi:hypothetical protein